VPESFVYLASQSPRRCELLSQLGVVHELLIADDDEDAESLEVALPHEAPRRYVARVTRLKAAAAAARRVARGLPDAPILVGDTTVALGGTILAKPTDADDARRMLRALSGRTHRVYTAIALVANGATTEDLSVSRVRMRTLGDDEIDAYLASGEPFGKAGAYAIQGRASAFVAHISGSHSGIVGLPLFETARLLAAAGVHGANPISLSRP
jgi:septum formation protein